MIVSISVIDKETVAISFQTDEDDLVLHQNENYRRFAVRYDDKAELFIEKALANDDRDQDGNSTILNCYHALKRSCPKGEEFSEYVLRYIQGFEYVSDSEQYDSFDWAAYPIETLSSMKGDCEDLAILMVSLLSRDYQCGIAVFRDHAIAMVAYEPDIGKEFDRYMPLSIEYERTVYYAMEATELCPPGYTFRGYGQEDILSFKTA